MVSAVAGGVVVAIKVTPRASRSGISDERDGVLHVRLAAAPVDNAANDELSLLLARTLQVPRRAVTVIAGARSRHKRVRVDGIGVADARRRLIGG